MSSRYEFEIPSVINTLPEHKQPQSNFFADNWRVLLLSAVVTPVPFYPAFGVLALIASVSATPLVFAALTAAAVTVTFLSAFAASKLLAVIGTWLFFPDPLSPPPPPPPLLSPSESFKMPVDQSFKKLNEDTQNPSPRGDKGSEKSPLFEKIYNENIDEIPSDILLEPKLEAGSNSSWRSNRKSQKREEILLEKSHSEKSLGSNSSAVSKADSFEGQKGSTSFFIGFRRKSRSPNADGTTEVVIPKPGSPTTVKTGTFSAMFRNPKNERKYLNRNDSSSSNSDNEGNDSKSKNSQVV